jgi:hypothetical protein
VNHASDPRPFITFSCFGVESCEIYVEPWGTKYQLSGDDVIYIHSEAFAEGGVELTYFVGGVSVGLNTEAEPTVFDKSGETLPL